MDPLPPSPTTELPPLLPAPAVRQPGRHRLSLFLSVCVALFVVDAGASFLDDATVLFTGVHAFSMVRALISLATVAMALVVYVMIGITPMVPKRFLLPIPLCFIFGMLAVFGLMVFWYHYGERIAFAVSSAELLVAIVLLWSIRRESKIRWPLVTAEQLGTRWFSWRNLVGFVLANVFVLLPLVVIYLFACGAGAVSHYSEGFMSLHPDGFRVQVRKYVRDDGKVIQLFPMSHVAAPTFYQEVARSFPTNSIILMEGVTDKGNLLTNKISYKRMAKTLGLAEQKNTFVPNPRAVVHADVDVGVFSPETIDFLNLTMLFHSQGMTVENIFKMMTYQAAPGATQRLFDDLLVKRNQHLLEEIQSHLLTSDSLMVPWGVAHMPGLAQEIEKFGFHQTETQEYVVIPFGHRRKESPISSK